MITVKEASSIILESIGAIDSEIVSISEAVGRVLREPILSDRPLPPFNRATVDGIALSSSAYHMGKKSFKIAATAPAGTPQQQVPNPNSCIEIMTGAIMPQGADCVIKFEDVEIEGDLARPAKDLALSPGTGVHYAGSDCEAGATLLESGASLTAKEIAIAASVGKTELEVSRLPRIAIVTTGDELVPVYQTPEVHQIRRSNDFTLAAALKSAGYPQSELFHIPDDPQETEKRLSEIIERFDTIILAGGVSKGKFDYVPETLAKLGVAIRFQWVSQRPGKPMWYGQAHKDGAIQPIFALPGNPVACFTCLRRYVIPALDKWTGKPPEKALFAKIEHDLTFKGDLTLFLPVKSNPRPSGELWVKPVLFNTSGDMVSVAKTDGFIELPRKSSIFPQGEPFRYFAWPV